MNFKSKVYLPAPLRKEHNDRKLLVIWLFEGWRWSKALAWNESKVSRDMQFNIYTLKSTKKLSHVKIYWKYETCGTRAHYINQWKSYRKSILKFTARTFWNMAEHIQELKSYKKSQFEKCTVTGGIIS